jgi:uncharacterized cupredoxin-like copper-binding protein
VEAPVTRAIVLAALLLTAAAAVACGGDDDDSSRPRTSVPRTSTLTVELTNWAVTPSVAVLQAGAVTITATHAPEHGGHGASEGGEVHQLILAPLEEGARSGESKFGLTLINLADIKIGESKVADMTLEPGTYELACLVVEDVDGEKVNHYEKGMHTAITVQ